MADDVSSNTQNPPNKAQSGFKAGLKAAGSGLQQSGRDEMDEARSMAPAPVAYRKGGKVRRTGMALVHKNERVIPASKRKKVDRLMKRAKMRKTDRSRR